MYIISKEFEFCYGHRVWNQDLVTNQECKCKRIHGHNGVIILELSSEKLKNSMVKDYQDLKPFKDWVDRVLDHRTILDINDPCLDSLMIKDNDLSRSFVENSSYGFYLVEDEYLVDSNLRGSFVLMDGVPTSENICKLIYEEWSRELGLSAVRFKETCKTEAIYYE